VTTQADPGGSDTAEAEGRVYTVGGNVVWGATARILSDLLERLRPLLAG